MSRSERDVRDKSRWLPLSASLLLYPSLKKRRSAHTWSSQPSIGPSSRLSPLLFPLLRKIDPKWGSMTSWFTPLGSSVSPSVSLCPSLSTERAPVSPPGPSRGLYRPLRGNCRAKQPSPEKTTTPPTNASPSARAPLSLCPSATELTKRERYRTTVPWFHPPIYY